MVGIGRTQSGRGKGDSGGGGGGGQGWSGRVQKGIKRILPDWGTGREHNVA